MLKQRRNLPSHLVAALALVLVFGLAMREFLTGRAFPLWDAERLFSPAYMLISDFARQGRLLWWNPWSNGGSPDFADIQYGAHSPVVLLLALLFGRSIGGFIAYWFAIWLLFGLGMIALARQWRVPAWGGFVVATCLMFSGFFVGHAEHTPVLFSWVWMPLVLYRLEVALAESRWAPAAQAGLLFGLSAAGGYPAIFFTNGVFLAFWIVARTLLSDGKGEDEHGVRIRPRGALRAGAVLSGVTAVVSAPAFYYFFHEGRGFTSRVGALPRDLAVLSNALHPRALLTFASPYLAALPPRGRWDYTDISSCSLYAGGLVFVFAVYALMIRPRSMRRWAMVLAAAFAVAASLGHDLPVRGWLYDWVPPTRYFRHPSWFRAYPIFILGLLALLGIRDYRRHGSESRAQWLLTAAAAASLGLATMAYAVLTRGLREPGRAYGDLHFAFAWLVPALMIPWLRFPVAWRRPAVLAVAFGVMAAADVVLGAGVATTLKLTNTQSQWASLARQYRPSVDLLKLDGAHRVVTVNGPYDNRHFLTRQAALLDVSALTNPFHDVSAHDRILAAAATSSDRFWFSAQPVRAWPTGAAFSTFMARVKALGAPPFVLHARDTMAAPAPAPAEDDRAAREILQAPAAEKTPVTIQRYLPDALDLVFQAPRAGWLLVSDRWSRGWKARVNGVEVPVDGANFVFRALPVRAGTNQVELLYRPPGYAWWPPLFWILVAGLGLATFLPGWRHHVRCPHQ